MKGPVSDLTVNLSFEECAHRKRVEMASNLILAYLATDYVVFSKGRTVSIRVGQRSLIVDALLTRMGARTGAFITAWKPFSKSQSVGTNAQRERGQLS